MDFDQLIADVKELRGLTTALATNFDHKAHLVNLCGTAVNVIDRIVAKIAEQHEAAQRAAADAEQQAHHDDAVAANEARKDAGLAPTPVPSESATANAAAETAIKES